MTLNEPSARLNEMGLIEYVSDWGVRSLASVRPGQLIMLFLIVLGAATVLQVIRLEMRGRKLERECDERALNLGSHVRFGNMKRKLVGKSDWRKRTFLKKTFFQ